MTPSSAGAVQRAAIFTLFGFVAVAAGASPAGAQARADSAALVIRLGHDTVAVERYVRTADRIEATSVTRSPRTTVRRWVATLDADGSVLRFATGPADAPLEERAPARAGAVPLAGGFQAPWALVLRRAHATGAESATVDVQVGNNIRPTPVRRVAPDRYALANQFDVPMNATLDAEGRLLAIDAGGGNTTERVAWFDIDALAAEFAARDARGAGLGPLSPRETVEASVHGATITVAYGRPALRGRPLAMLVPVGAVWRTGANEETVLTTNRPLEFDGVTLPAGTFSVFTRPSAAGWTLILNRQTGQGGLGHDPSHDLGAVPMRTRTDVAPAVDRFTIEVRPAGTGGELVFRWGGTEASANFRVGAAPNP
jgi:hypothetical protein